MRVCTKYGSEKFRQCGVMCEIPSPRYLFWGFRRHVTFAIPVTPVIWCLERLSSHLPALPQNFYDSNVPDQRWKTIVRNLRMCGIFEPPSSRKQIPSFQVKPGASWESWVDGLEKYNLHSS